MVECCYDREKAKRQEMENKHEKSTWRKRGREKHDTYEVNEKDGPSLTLLSYFSA